MKNKLRTRPALVLTASLATLLSATALPGCQTVRTKYYDAWEAFGYDKRERLVDYVAAASASQGEAKEQFVSALDRFKALTSFDGGNLETTYNELNTAFLSAEARAADVKGHIDSVENVSRSLFDEWDDEIGMMSDPKIVRASEQLKERTRDSLDEVVAAMKKAEESMDPILTKFRDRVLFLKTQLNAAAIASLRDEELDLSDDIDELIADMEDSIARADAFIAENKPAGS